MMMEMVNNNKNVIKTYGIYFFILIVGIYIGVLVYDFKYATLYDELLINMKLYGNSDNEYSESPGFYGPTEIKEGEVLIISSTTAKTKSYPHNYLIKVFYGPLSIDKEEVFFSDGISTVAPKERAESIINRLLSMEKNSIPVIYYNK